MTRTELSRARHKESRSRTDLDALLESTWLAHVAIVRDGAPAAFPTAVARWRDELVLHGSTGSPWLRHAAGGAELCVAVTAVDALVVARSAFESSIRYRSAVVYGVARVLDGEEKSAALDVLTDRLIPGRAGEVRASTARELAATVVLALPLEEWSLKISAGWPEDPAEDVAGDAWAGVVPLVSGFGEPLDAPDLRAGIEVPPSVRGLGD